MSSQAAAPFRGRFEIKLDPKGRLSLPQLVRQSLPVKNPEVVITNSRYRGRNCLHLYTLVEWQNLERRIARLSSLKAEVQAFNRFYLSGGLVVEVDAQNRILVPQSLRRFAGLETNAVIVGLGEKLEIWAQDSWSSIYEHLTDNFEETMNSVAALESHLDSDEDR